MENPKKNQKPEAINFNHYPSLNCVKAIKKKYPNAKIILPDGKEFKNANQGQ
jgi:hypothetical protein